MSDGHDWVKVPPDEWSKVFALWRCRNCGASSAQQPTERTMVWYDVTQKHYFGVPLYLGMTGPLDTCLDVQVHQVMES